MADFTHDFWNWYIAGITVIAILACGWLLFANLTRKSSGSTETMGHKWDGDLEEYNNPLPAWWVWLFVITLVFGAVYLVMYPGLGSHRGTQGWDQASQYRAEIQKADARYEPIYKKYLAMDIPQVAADPAARAMGERLFLNNCAQCHGSDARGGKGFPNLTDNDWLWGGAPAQIKQSIIGGRQGVMPPMAAAVGTPQDVSNMAQYVLSLSGAAHEQARAVQAKDKFMVCAACHGVDGKGNQALGAPNLTDKIWLYGGSAKTIMETINLGRQNQMPGFGDFLGEAKAHVVAAYVWSLSNTPTTQP
jgi:cytochrome c oxidase cbb3-type subunit 3